MEQTKIHDEIINGVKVHRVNLRARSKSRLSLIRNYLSFWWNSKHYLAHLHEEFDLVYGMSMSPLISVEGGGIYAKKHGKPHVIHCLDLWPESAVIAGKVRKNSLMYRFLYHSSRRIYSMADEILISSPSFASYFSDVLKLPEKKVLFVPQPPLVNPLPSEGVVYPKKYNLVYAGNVGNLQLIENYVRACMLWGRFAKQYLPLIRHAKHIALCASHPSPMAANQGGWFGKHLFSQCNNFLVENGLTPIDWQIK